mmetsp:Transcript_8277/g.22073  ORF Transcript_8277/g.22073 Transcript_8277/m.22073 type:complete len:111 (+) Transcript_8277:1605-1937(+)|eukprot:1158619-Pelagomonas_calceolata.AAC.2
MLAQAQRLSKGAANIPNSCLLQLQQLEIQIDTTANLKVCSMTQGRQPCVLTKFNGTPTTHAGDTTHPLRTTDRLPRARAVAEPSTSAQHFSCTLKQGYNVHAPTDKPAMQ